MRPALAQCAAASPHAELLPALQAIRGIGFLTAVTIVAEAGDLRRFPTARQFMAYVGLVPSEHSSGDSRHRGHITKTGNRDRPESVPLRPSGAQTPMYDPAECQREPSQTSQPAPF